MAKKCLECGRKRSFFEYNYAGFDVKAAGSHRFPDRIESLVLPGDRKKDFLCAQCANKHKLVCKIHGEVGGRIESRRAPRCWKCSDEEVCPFCGSRFEAPLVTFVTPDIVARYGPHPIQCPECKRIWSGRR